MKGRNDAVRRFGAALAAHRAGRLDEAERGYRAVLADRPRHADASHLLGVLLYQKGEPETALALIDEALRVRPDAAEFHANRALVLLVLRRETEADGAVRRALALREAYPEAHNTAGNIARNLGDPQAAERHYRRALDLRPAYPEVLVNLGTSLFEQERHAEAEESLRAALRLVPGDHQAWCNLGAVLRATGRLADAEAALTEALTIVSGDPETLVNLGLLRESQERTAEAEAAYRKAIARAPGFARARLDLGLLRLKAGALDEGFDLYDARFDARVRTGWRNLSLPAWQGGDPAGLRLLVWREQGIGDELLFGSCLPDLADAAGSLTVECDARLAGLFARALPGSLVRAETGRMSGDFDAHVPVSGLARYFRRSLSRFPARPSWLSPEPEKAALWRGRLDALGPGLKIGICWRSKVMSGERRAAYTEPSQWASLAMVPGLVLVNLQYDGREDEFGEFERLGLPLRRWSGVDLMGDLETAAALTCGLDLVLSVATSVGEMAGALGVPVWRIVGAADWTMLGTAVRPWFPTMRVWTPRAGQGIGDALARAVDELKRLAAPVREDPVDLANRAVEALAGGRAEEALSLIGRALARMPDAAGLRANRALALLALGRNAEALSAIGGALVLDPALADAWNTRAHLRLSSDCRDALRCADRALMARSVYVEAYGNRSRALLALGRAGEAVTASKNALSRRPYDPGLTAGLALALAAAGEADAAARAWWRIILLEPAAGEAFAGLAELRAEQGRFDAAARGWTRALASMPERDDWRRCLAGAKRALRPPVPASPQAQFDEAIVLHRAGRLAEAEALYAEVLKARPRDADVLHLLGMIAMTAGRAAEAEELFRRAVAVNAKAAAFHADHASALQFLGRNREAETAARRALRLDRGLAEAANTLGNALAAQGRLGEALPAYREALRIRPDYAEAEGNLGLALYRDGRNDEAEGFLRRAVARDPARADLRQSLGAVLVDRGELVEGAVLLRGAVRDRPDNAAGWAMLASIAGLAVDEAVLAWRRALVLDPTEAGLWLAAGKTFKKAERLADAAAALFRSLTLDPRQPEALGDLGEVRRLQGRALEAAALQKRAIELDREDTAAWTNLALALQDGGDLTGAEAACDEALRLNSGEALARMNRGMMRLRRGLHGDGWADYDARFDAPELFAPRRFAFPRWRGEEPGALRILAWREQGLGDELMFGTCLPDLVARATHVVVECDPRLAPLIGRSLPKATVRAPTVDPRDADRHVPFGTLPRYLRRSLAEYPQRQAWLFADPIRVERWRTRLAEAGPGLKVGFSWTSRLADVTRAAAYTGIDAWAPLFALPGVVPVSLQYDGRFDELRRSGERVLAFPDTDLMNDLEEAAALTAALDLVVTVPNSVGEMAAALGVPVWRVAGPDWTSLSTAVRPWYPAMALAHPGGSPADAIARAARRLIRMTS